ncbi:MAG: hypothetical protein PF487_07335 [Bacteroidales bacterium]|jgi:hypothetical protein|nr:hypothetical protein [Bacteroidales bacterium]
MENDINKKNSPNQMREMMKRIREGKFTANESKESKKDLTMRNMLKITRTINEKVNGKETVYDQSIEEKKFLDFFDDMNVSIKFIELEVFGDLVFWGGTIDGVIQFVYKVTPDESTSGIEFNYLKDFSPDNPENEEITGRIESYFDTFYKYWRDNVMTADSAEKDEEK